MDNVFHDDSVAPLSDLTSTASSSIYLYRPVFDAWLLNTEGERQLEILQPAHMAVSPFQIAFASCVIKGHTSLRVFPPNQQTAFDSYSSLFFSSLAQDSLSVAL